MSDIDRDGEFLPPGARELVAPPQPRHCPDQHQRAELSALAKPIPLVCSKMMRMEMKILMKFLLLYSKFYIFYINYYKLFLIYIIL
jgi:hypothetical protein